MVAQRKRRQGRGWGATALALALVLTACTSADEEPNVSLPEVMPTLSPTTTTTTVPEPEAAEATTPDDSYLWEVGDCVDLGTDAAIDLPYAPYGRELLTNCARQHTHEVYFTARLPEGPDDPFPDDLNAVLFDICFIEFGAQMGFPSADSTLNIILYLPDREEWSAGERYHACVVYQAAPDAGYQHLVGSATDDPDSFRWQVTAGDCFDTFDPLALAVSETVDCAQRHTFEMIGEAVLGPADGDYPGIEPTSELVVDACDALLAEYADQSLFELPVLTIPLPTLLAEGDWVAGARAVRCFAFAGTPESGLLEAVGSLGEGTFEVVDSPPEGTPA